VVSYVIPENGDETEYHLNYWKVHHKIESADLNSEQWEAINSGLTRSNKVYRHDGQFVGNENTPVYVNNEGLVVQGNPLPQVSGYLAVKSEKNGNTFTVSINPNNIETWTFTVLNENDEPETITKRVVALNEQF
jgi:hypothetical protein